MEEWGNGRMGETIIVQMIIKASILGYLAM